MTGMRLWGRATSFNVQKVTWAIAELGLDIERIDAGGAFGGLDTDDYGAKNPNRRVPTLEDGELVLWESNVIVRYLADTRGRGTLSPADPKARARADQWMDWMQTTLATPFTGLFWETYRKPPSQRSAERSAALMRETTAALAIVEAELARTGWLAGPELTMADIPVGAALYRWFTLDLQRPDLPRIRDYYDRLASRPAYRDTVMTSYESLRGRDPA